MGNQNRSGNSLMHSLLDLMRWDKPIGTWLLFWPCSWGIVLAAASHSLALLPTLNLLALFFLGSLIMRSAGCVINDLWDRDFDAQVERTRSRPLASGAVSVKQAIALLAVLLTAALMIVSQLRLEVFWMAWLALPLVIAYPLMKRITWWPQAFLGLTFNFGALMGWVAVTGTIELPAILLYISGLFWTLGYDTIYAFQDIEDDLKIGVKSTAIRLQRQAKPAINLFYLSCIALHAAALMVAEASFYALFACSLPLFSLLQQMHQFNPKQPASCGKLFRHNAWIGFFLLIPSFLHFLTK